MTIQTIAIEQYFSVALFIKLYKAVLTFESVNEILILLPIETKSIEWFCYHIFALNEAWQEHCFCFPIYLEIKVKSTMVNLADNTEAVLLVKVSERRLPRKGIAFE